MTSEAKRVLAGLLDYWPRLDEVKAMATEAEELSDPVLLAVHRHVDLVRRPFAGSDPGARVQEDALLDFVLHGLKPEGYLLAPITGPSGAGKSHLVRWLEIRLRNHPEATHFNLVRVPKSASLRTVVESVLAPVAHLPEYAQILEALRDATSALTASEAALLFGATMRLGLEEKAKQWKQERATIAGVATQTLAAHADQLGDFLQDPVIAPHFRVNVYPRLLARAMRGRIASEDGDRPPQFELQDLVLPPDVAGRLNDAAQSTQRYYLTRLERANGRESALVALNAVIDSAVARVFKLGQLTHGRTLQDIMRELRQKLHQDGRELVLLVEDFYALTGIQDELLSLCIQRVHDAIPPMCPMRTVMAMTDSTLDGRDTIKTRSEHQWALVTDESNDDYVVDALLDLIGRYLNAARIGRERLAKSYDPSTGSVALEFHAEMDDERSSELREAFGKSPDGIALFPLSRNSVHFLARKHLVSGGRLFFNPRTALQRIVRDVLLCRQAFEHGTFPSGLAISDPLAVELTRVLDSVPERERERYRRTIVCWGNDPRTFDELRRMPEEIFEAFGLDCLPELRGGIRSLGQGSTEKAPSATRRPTETASPTTDAATPVNERWRNRMDEWVRGTRLDLRDANELRKIILAHVIAYIDWNAISLSPADFDAQTFELPKALGGERRHKPECPVIKVVGPTGKIDSVEARLARELLGLLRFDKVKSWNYAEGDEDSVLVRAFLERMAGKLEQAALEAAELKLPALAHGALLCGAIQGGLRKPRALPECLASTIYLHNAPPIPSGVNRWDTLRTECFKEQDSLRKSLMRYVRVVQGDVETLRGIDAARLTRALATPAPDATAIAARLKDDAGTPPNVKALLPKLTAPRLKPIVDDLVRELRAWMKSTITDPELKGDPSEQAGLTQAATALMDGALREGFWPSAARDGTALPDHDSMKEGARIFVGLPWSALKEQCEAVLSNDTSNHALTVSLLAHLQWSELHFARTFISDFMRFLGALELQIEANELVVGTGGSAKAIDDMSSELESLEKSLTALTGDGA